MSHCTRFDFCYSDEESIVRSFEKMGLHPFTDVVSEFTSELSKNILARLGSLGSNQYRAICANSGKFQLLACRTEDDRYELFIERAILEYDDERKMKDLSHAFRKAYICVAMEDTVRAIEASNVPARVRETPIGYEIEFGTNYEYGIKVTMAKGEIIEEVTGVQGDVCTKLTELIETMLSHPSTELRTEWKPEYNINIEEQVLQVLSINL